MATATKSKEELLNRLEKLLALGDVTRGGSEAEAKLAMERAQALMREHNIAMAEVAAVGRAKKMTSTVRLGNSGRVEIAGYKWEIVLADAAAALVDARVLVQKYGTYPNGRPKKTLYFFGEEADVAVAHRMFEYLYRLAHAGMKAEGSASDKRSWSMGFAVMLRARASMLKARAKESSTALVLYDGEKRDAIAKAVEKIPEIKEGRKTAINAASYSRGQVEGMQVDLGTKNRLA